MSKYDPLFKHLCRTGDGPVEMSFADIDRLVGGLPASATADGWKVAALLMDYGLPIKRIGQMWTFEFGRPSGPDWIVTFREKIA